MARYLPFTHTVTSKVLDLFREWDTDGSASVDQHEFSRAIESLGFHYRCARQLGDGIW